MLDTGVWRGAIWNRDQGRLPWEADIWATFDREAKDIYLITTISFNPLEN